MVAAAGFPSSPTPPALQTPHVPAMRKQWETEFSRFFIFPPRESTAAAPLRPLYKARGMLRYREGIWITASSPASILIVKDSCYSDTVLTVSVSGYIHEEHLLTSLRFSWPRVACVSECPIRGSRAFFFSFKDRSNQIQKFAVRLSTHPVAASFFNFLQDCSRDAMDIASPASVFVFGSSPSETFSSNVVQSRSDVGQSHDEAITMQTSATFGGGQSDSPLPSIISNINTTFSEFPPSFTELLTNCSNQMAIEASKQLEESNHEAWSGKNVPNPSPENVSEQLMLEEDVKNQVAVLSIACLTGLFSLTCELCIYNFSQILSCQRYMANASFHGMLFKIEKVIDELGGDLSL